jgi:hypothetical protein
MKKLIAVGMAAAAVVGATGFAYAKPPPTAENMQAWAAKQQRYTTRYVPVLEDPIVEEHSDSEKLYTTATGAVGVLDLAYGRMFQLRGQGKSGYGEVGAGGSGYVDAVRKILTHSPDPKLNKLFDKALDCAGTAFDNYHFGSVKLVRECEGRWAKIEGTFRLYGVPTGDPWNLAGEESAS